MELSVKIFPHVILVVLLACSSPARSAKPEINYRLGSFNRQLLHEVFTTNENQNTLISPFALRSALSMVLMGTGGETADEIEQTLRQYETESEILEKYGSLLANFKSETNLKIANIICLNHKFRLKDNFLQIVTGQFYSTRLLVDFFQLNQAMEVINETIGKNTNYTIKNVLQPQDLGHNPEALLLSTAHFNGDFALPLPAEGIEEKPFRLNATSRINIPMMKYKGKFEYAMLTKDLLSTAIRIPYRDSDLSLIVIKPADRMPMKRFMRIIQEIDFDLRSLKRKFTEAEGYIILPKFKAQFQMNLKYFLKKMGMTKFFTSARFDKMIEQNQAIHFNDVIHQASIEINESVEKVVPYDFANTMHRQYEIFEADRTFYYAIVNSQFEPIFEGTFAGMSM
ncbi:serine protease inhibitor 42Dd-like [Musca vetustissima]|uniref:serine protease inhibitor 42Dd-like n=1 Tax=Musca vetustissima TaxID=27455 RepID=UPI002AB723DF|nr:serine protease inhibitor 42Dd-like [Musca vetustissima]